MSDTGVEAIYSHLTRNLRVEPRPGGGGVFVYLPGNGGRLSLRYEDADQLCEVIGSILDTQDGPDGDEDEDEQLVEE